MFLALLIACQEPFGADRHDLEGFRIAVVTAEVDDDTVRPQAVVSVGGRLWSETPIELAWAWIEDVGAATSKPTPVAFGPLPTLPHDADRLALRVRADGEEAWAELDLVDRSRLNLSLSIQTLVPRIESLTVEELTREERRAWPAEAGEETSTGGSLRATLTGAPAEARGRFMATGDGTFLELESDVADWFAAEVSIDDDEIESTAIDTGTYTVLAAALTASGSGFAAHDVHVGTPLSGVWVQKRYLPADTVLTGRIWAVLEAEDRATAGLRLIEVEPAESGATWSPADVGCEGVQGMFDPNWMMTGVCAREDLIGERVLIEVDP